MQQTTFLGKLTNRPSIFLVLAALLIAMAAAPLTAGAHHKPGHAGGPPGLDELRNNLSIDFVDFEAELEGVEDTVEGTFTGVFNITGFDVVDGQLFAVGTVVGDFFPEEGDPLPVNESGVYAPVGWNSSAPTIQQNNNQERCPILYLEIGPIYLDLLGLVIEIPQEIILDIYATPGPGQLLGNLLCAIVGLLDGPTGGGLGGALENLLNQVNQLLSRLLG
jgi:hypothetical protein